MISRADISVESDVGQSLSLAGNKASEAKGLESIRTIEWE
jgi:hypothetical protein